MTAFHFIGIGGAGMSVVAELLAARGHTISGSDNRASDVTRRLAAQGIEVAIGHDEANVPDEAAVVVSSAIRQTNPELAIARRRDQMIYHRSQALALAAEGMDFVAVAGAHGKTTTSAMIATALRQAGADPSWAIGGTVMGVGGGGHLGKGPVFVAEADESDASFLNYEPRLAVVTNVEPDHLDHYGSREAFEDAFVQFARRIVPGGLLVACADSEGSRALARQAAGQGLRVVTYGFGEGVEGAEGHVSIRQDGAAGAAGQSGLEGQSDRDSQNGQVGQSGQDSQVGIAGTFDDGQGPVDVKLAVVGQHNLLNAAGAWAAGVELGVDREAMAQALASFAGTGRRFELRGTAGAVRVIDDYAHHPTEIEATLRAAREVAGEGSLRVLFQPHLYSRTHNFAAEFARALSLADDVVVTGVYAAREDPIEGVEGDIITQRMDGRARFVRDRMEAARDIASRATGADLVMTVGAGDVTELGPVILSQLGQP